MNDSFNAWLVRGTAILVVAAYVARTLCEVRWQRSTDARAGRRLVQSHVAVGCFLLLHIMVAFHFWHSWSIDHALAHTAQRTFEVTGLRTEIGLWANFLFVLLWWWFVIPLRRWVLDPSRYQRWLNRSFQAGVGFFVFNATVVFGPTYWIPWTALLISGLVILRPRS